VNFRHVYRFYQPLLSHALGFALEMLGEHPKAKSQYEATLLIDRAHATARRRLARLKGGA
jgi:hypothetical protein